MFNQIKMRKENLLFSGGRKNAEKRDKCWLKEQKK
jgi:hypothetical protein